MDDLPAAYARCRELHRRHGRTYYLATRLLPAWKRRHVHALYGFTRYADDIVDRTAAWPTPERARRLADWSARFLAGLSGAPAMRGPGRGAEPRGRDCSASGPGRSAEPRGPDCSVSDPLLPAVLHTVRVFDLDVADFQRFLGSMAADLTVTSYETYADLLEYMEGSAAAIGTMMLPILGSRDAAAAREPARQLGLAFQLTNFIRDVAEDLGRGRIYLPLADLTRFGVAPADLARAVVERRATPAIRELVAYQVQRARAHYRVAATGIPLLDPSSQACIRAAYRVYGAILTEIEALDYDVFRRRAVVPNGKRLALAAGCLVTRSGRPVAVPGRPADPRRTPRAAALAALL